MGVPGFFMWIISNYDKRQIITDNIDMNIDDLYLDANCLFHPQCFKVIDDFANNKTNKIDNNNLEKLMMQKIIEYIDYIIDYVKPNKKIFIAVDGVAPMAKMNQQRKRRFKSVQESIIRNQIKEKYNKQTTDWQNTVITPGTEFMEKLHNYILNYIATIKHTKVIYSSYHTYGEGEHKIFEDIKLNNKNNSIAIYGLDADLIFLSLATNMNNLYLLREKNVFSKKEIQTDDYNQPLIYVSIDALKWCINNKIINQINIERNIVNNKVDFVNDFIFMCYFLGNDFIPHIPSIDIYTGGLDMIIKNYSKLYGKYKTNLLNTTNLTINKVFLIDLLKCFQQVEDYYFRQIKPKYNKSNNKTCKSSDPYDIEIWEFENLKNIKSVDNINLGEDDKYEYKARYYSYYYNSYEHKNILINDMCKEYFNGLAWTLKYYFKSNKLDKFNKPIDTNPSWDWQYPFTTSPFISDLFIYAEMNDINNITFDKSTPVTPLEQLLIVLPPICHTLLPVNYKHLMTSDESPIIDLYPVTTHIETTNIDMLWKTIPLLPIVDVDRIKRAITGIKLSGKEQYRNVFLDNINNY